MRGVTDGRTDGRTPTDRPYRNVTERNGIGIELERPGNRLYEMTELNNRLTTAGRQTHENETAPERERQQDSGRIGWIHVTGCW